MKCTHGVSSNLCKPCRAAYQRNWRAQQMAQGKNVNRNAMLKRNYGISEFQFVQLLKSQNYLCAICGTDKPTSASPKPGCLPNSMSIDHCHQTGKIRGLLCSACNRAVGLLKDDPNRCEKAAAYLRQPFPKIPDDQFVAKIGKHGRIQNLNGRPKLMSFRGETKSLKEWAKESCIKNEATFYARLSMGWTLEEALTTPLQTSRWSSVRL